MRTKLIGRFILIQIVEEAVYFFFNLYGDVVIQGDMMLSLYNRAGKQTGK